jgi:hypothetical protein
VPVCAPPSEAAARRHADGDVVVLFGQIHPAIGDRQVDRGFQRMAREKLGQRRRNMQRAEGDRGADAQDASRFGIQAGDKLLRPARLRSSMRAAMLGDRGTNFGEAQM